MRSSWLLVAALMSPLQARAAPESSLLSAESALGGAVIAANDDGGGGWYNPASLGGLSRSSVQLGVSAYSYSWVNATGVLKTILPWETQSQNANTSRYSSVPSVLGLTFKLREGLGLSVGLWTPFHDSFTAGFSTISQGPLPADPGLRASLIQRYDWAGRADATWAMAAVGWQLHPDVRLGLSLQGGLLTGEEWVDLNTTLSTDSTRPADGGAHLRVRVREVSSRVAFRGVLGAQWKVSRFLRLGAAVRSPELRIVRWGERVRVAMASSLLPGFAPQEGAYIDSTPPDQGPLMVEHLRGLLGAVVELGALSLRVDGEWSPALASPLLRPSVKVRLGALYSWDKDLTVGLGVGFDSVRTYASAGSLSLDRYTLSGGITYRGDKVVKALGGGLWDLLGTLAVAGTYGVGTAPGMTIAPLDMSQSIVPVLASPGAPAQPFQEVPVWMLDLSIHFMTTVKF